MTNMRNTLDHWGLRAISVALAVAICLSLFTILSWTGLRGSAAEVKTFEQDIVITQTVSGNAQRTTYTYKLTPNIAGTVMPTGGPGTYDEKTQTYTFTLTGDDSITIPMTFTVSDEVNYQYLLTRVEVVPTGDTVTPADHHFGYWFKVENGELQAIPYTCYDAQFKICTDEQGEITGVKLKNEIVGTKGDKGDQGEKGDKGDQGEKGEKGDPGTDGKDGKDGSDGTNGKDGSNGTDGRDGTDGKNGTNGTNGRDGKDGVTTIKTITQTVTKTVAKAVNTGDPNHILLWGGLILASGGALIAIVIVRRKRERDEENF